MLRREILVFLLPSALPGSSLVLAKQSGGTAPGAEEPAPISVHVTVKLKVSGDLGLSILGCVCVESTQSAILLTKDLPKWLWLSLGKELFVDF